MSPADRQASSSCLAISVGSIDFLDAWELQRRLHRRVAEGFLPDVLLLLEHPHVYTLGRRGEATDILASPEKLAAIRAQVHHVDRGGQVTYHGPGQLVGYPILNLRSWGGGPLKYVRTLEQTLVATMEEFRIRVERADRPTGVWVSGAKIAAIGVKVSRGVTMHGFALNVAPDLSYFDHIVPCGMPDARVTSMAAELSMDVDMQAVLRTVGVQFGHAFGRRVEWATLDGINDLLRRSSDAAPVEAQV